MEILACLVNLLHLFLVTREAIHEELLEVKILKSRLRESILRRLPTLKRIKTFCLSNSLTRQISIRSPRICLRAHSNHNSIWPWVVKMDFHSTMAMVPTSNNLLKSTSSLKSSNSSPRSLLTSWWMVTRDLTQPSLWITCRQVRKEQEVFMLAQWSRVIIITSPMQHSPISLCISETLDPELTLTDSAFIHLEVVLFQNTQTAFMGKSTSPKSQAKTSWRPLAQTVITLTHTTQWWTLVSHLLSLIREDLQRAKWQEIDCKLERRSNSMTRPSKWRCLTTRSRKIM